MRVTILILLIVSQHCYAQNDYSAKLSTRLEEIRKLSIYDNGLVVYDKISGYGATLPRWESKMNFYQGDLITFHGESYEAVADNIGKNPITSPSHWHRLNHGPRPYLFLKDTAKFAGLRALLTSDHPFIRTYAFAALVHRKDGDLFQTVLDNLKDTTRISQITADYIHDMYPAELMIQYSINQFTIKQKDVLKELILTKYTHLNKSVELLIK